MRHRGSKGGVIAPSGTTLPRPVPYSFGRLRELEESYSLRETRSRESSPLQSPVFRSDRSRERISDFSRPPRPLVDPGPSRENTEPSLLEVSSRTVSPSPLETSVALPRDSLQVRTGSGECVPTVTGVAICGRPTQRRHPGPSRLIRRPSVRPRSLWYPFRYVSDRTSGGGSEGPRTNTNRDRYRRRTLREGRSSRMFILNRVY